MLSELGVLSNEIELFLFILEMPVDTHTHTHTDTHTHTHTHIYIGGRHIIIQIEEYNVIQKKSLGHRVNPTV